MLLIVKLSSVELLLRLLHQVVSMSLLIVFIACAFVLFVTVLNYIYFSLCYYIYTN